MKSILTVVGARPQFVKASVVSRAFREVGGIREVLVHTGQHFDRNMSDIFFDELALPDPAYNLGIGGGRHGAMTGQMLTAIEQVLLAERPEAVLVYGDTNSTLAGALAAVKLHIRVAHVEAGLRSFNLRMPEEVNRVLTDRISNWLFTPTPAAYDNLCSEGVDVHQITATGDVMYDVAKIAAEKAESSAALFDSIGVSAGRYLLVTAHRAENTDDAERLRVIVAALSILAQTSPVVWPMHPRTRVALNKTGLFDLLASSNMRIIEPVGYLDMVKLETGASVIITDSGGVQKEAYFFGVPCVTLRDETEWVELVETGWNRLTPPTDVDQIVETVLASRGARGQSIELYGNGDAARKIVAKLAADVG